MNNTLIFIIIFFLLGMYIYYTDCIEGFAVDTATNDATNDAIKKATNDTIKKAVNDIYLADVDAIRNLSEVATKLQTAGVTLPGDFTVKGKININGVTTLNNNTILKKSLTVDNDINTKGKLKENGNDLVPKGTIVAYHPSNFTDATTDIVVPGGWALCDGTNGTPDLRGRFIKGASTTITSEPGIDVFGDGYVVGRKINNKSGVDDGILGISRTNKNSWIFKMKHGDYGGTDHMVLTKNELPKHTHTYDKVNVQGISASGSNKSYRAIDSNRFATVQSGDGSPPTAESTDGLFGSGHNNLPPYYVLTYIMKL